MTPAVERLLVSFQNATFQAEKTLKADILNKLGTDQLFCLLRDQCVDVVIKTLGFLRNLLSNKPHIDHIMEHSGDQVRWIFERTTPNCLCSFLRLKDKTLSAVLRSLVKG